MALARSATRSMAWVMRRASRIEIDASDESAENGRDPEREQRGAVGAPELSSSSLVCVICDWPRSVTFGEERLLERKNLVLERVVGLRGALRGLRLVECLDLLFERLQRGESVFESRRDAAAS